MVSSLPARDGAIDDERALAVGVLHTLKALKAYDRNGDEEHREEQTATVKEVPW